ncbi:MAG: SGNH/GDSL hydrolase family protein [Clostridia bacterium]|nr:SGNH/GDSL hydrolase family protein [Clostridia bacterium]
MKRTVLKIGGVLLACILLFGALFAITRLLMPKYRETSVEGSLTAEYYRDTTPHDVLFIGDCEVFSNFSPVTLWNEYGIPSYIRGSAQQLVWHSYYLLEDALQTETPKVVVYNVLALKYGEPQSEAYNRMTLDGMRWGKAKTGAIKAGMTEGEDFMSYVFPLLRFHARWSELGSEDFAYWFKAGEPVSFNGYLLRTEVRPATETPLPPVLKDPHLPETSMAWLEKTAALCKENGIDLVLIKSPSIEPYWYPEWDADVAAFAEAHGLWYVNMIEQNDAIGIDMQTDTCDMGQHLNVYGAEKLSRWFGSELKTRYALADRRGDEALDAAYRTLTERYETEKLRLTEGN